jgi:hypothetical protein
MKIKNTILGLILLFSHNLFSQTKIDTMAEKIRIPFLLIIDDTVKTSFNFTMIIDDTSFQNILFEKYLEKNRFERIFAKHLQKNKYSISGTIYSHSIHMFKNEFEILYEKNPKIVLYFYDIDPYYVYFEFHDNFRNLIDIDYNVLEIKTTTKKHVFKYRYKSNSFEKKKHWKNKYSKLTF